MLNFGIIGAGRISKEFCGALKLLPEAQTVAVAAQDMARAQKFALDQGIPRAYGSYAQFLSDRSVDAVYIGNTTNMHYATIKMCLVAGKHVVCEKPMTMTKAQAEECFALAARKGLFLMEAMWSRFMPKSRKVREWIKDGRIGNIVSMHATIGNYIEKDMKNRFYNKELGGGALYDLGIYPIDLMTYYSGLDITGYSAKIRWAETGVDDTVDLTLDLQGVSAHALITFSAPTPEDIFIFGEKGYIHVPKAHWGSEAYLYGEDKKLADKISEGVRYGMLYEAEEAAKCIAEGRLTSDIASPEMTYKSASIFDDLLADAPKTE